MATSKLLRRIGIESPCSASWEQMAGNDLVRFCKHCDLSVTDLSQMTRARAVKLVKRSEGRLCLRIHRDPSGEIITRPVMQKLHSISRRTSRIAAGAFTAVLSMSTAAYSQSGPTGPVNENPPVAEQPINPNSDGPVIETDRISVMGGDVAMVVNYQQPLVKAAHDGDLDAINQLLANGENPDQAEEDGTTALELAVGSGNIDIVRRLLAAGASVATTTEGGKTILFSLDDDSTSELIKLLVNAGADVNQADDDGDTPLTSAAEWDDEELITSLIESGAYVNAQNKHGYSALMVASEQGNADTVKALLAAGAIFGLRNADGADALALAQENDNDEICDILSAAGAIATYRPDPVAAPDSSEDDPGARPK